MPVEAFFLKYGCIWNSLCILSVFPLKVLIVKSERQTCLQFPVIIKGVILKECILYYL